MKKYREDEPCPKCGSAFKDINYENNIGLGEYIRVDCRTCGFSYRASTLDAKE